MPHPRTVVLMMALAKKAARRRGLADPRQIMQRASAKIATEIWRRAAQMVMACLPCVTEDAEDAPLEEVDVGKSEPPGIRLGA